MARKKRPTVSFKSFHEVRLPKRERHIIQRRATRYARKLDQPQIIADKKIRALTMSQYAGQLSANRNAISGTTSAINQEPLSGLRGQFRQAVKGFQQNQIAATQNSLAPLQSDVRQQRAQALIPLQTNIIQDRADMQTDQAREAYALTKAARARAATVLENQHQAAVKQRQNVRSRQKDVETAFKIAKNQFVNTQPAFLPWGVATQHGVNTPGGFHIDNASVHPPLTQHQWWANFKQGLLSKAQVDEPAVDKALQMLRRQLAQVLHGHHAKSALAGTTLPPPGAYPYPEFPLP